MLYPLSYGRPSRTGASDWTRIADPRGVAEIRTIAHHRRVLRTVLAVPVLLLAAGCAGSSSPPEPGPTSIAAFPDLPHMTGPLPVRLQPALPMVGGASCNPGQGSYCLGDQGYRALGDEREAVVAEVSTRPNEGHTAWDTVVRFRSVRAPRLATEQAAGMGGVVLVVAADDRVLAAVPPLDLAAGKAQFLGLEKAEAWALVEAFSRSKQGM